MVKTIKVIDLLNKIANGEIETGTKIKLYGKIYRMDYPNLAGIYEENAKHYNYETNIFSNINDICTLHHEVEIIEEDKKKDNKIEKIQWDFSMLQELSILDNLGLQRNLIAISDTINQIIDRINKMEEK